MGAGSDEGGFVSADVVLFDVDHQDALPFMTMTDSSALWKWVVVDDPAWKVVIPLEILEVPTSLVTPPATLTPGARRRFSTSSLLIIRGSDLMRSLIRVVLVLGQELPHDVAGGFPVGHVV